MSTSARANHPVAKRKDQTRYHPETTIAASIKSRLNFKPDEPNLPLSHAANCLKAFDDGQRGPFMLIHPAPSLAYVYTATLARKGPAISAIKSLASNFLHVPRNSPPTVLLSGPSSACLPYRPVSQLKSNRAGRIILCPHRLLGVEATLKPMRSFLGLVWSAPPSSTSTRHRASSVRRAKPLPLGA